MKLSSDTVNGLVDDLSLRLGGGTLTIYDKETPFSVPSFSEPLVTVRLRTPAFEPSVDGSAHVLQLEPTLVLRNGNAGWGRVSTASGKPVADLVIAESGTTDVHDADITLDRLDLSRGGAFKVQGWLFRLPSR